MTHDTPIPNPVPSRIDCRILTYNVLYEGVGPDGHEWDRRRDALVSELERLAPDVIAFQEVWMNQPSHLADAVPEHSLVGADDSEQHTPIAYREELFELLSWGTFWLSPPETKAGVPGWDATYQRLVTHATLRDRHAGQELSVFSVHLDHEGERARTAGITMVRERLTEIVGTGEAVVAGDFNCPPGSPAYERATANRDGLRPLTDAATVGTVIGPEDSYVGFTPEADAENIDHVLVTDGLGVERVVTCVPPAESAKQPSDHRPVFADLEY